MGESGEEGLGGCSQQSPLGSSEEDFMCKHSWCAEKEGQGMEMGEARERKERSRFSLLAPHEGSVCH